MRRTAKITSSELLTYGVAFLCAVVLHGAVIAIMSINWEDTTLSYTDIRPYYIEAAVVSGNPFTAEEKRQSEQERNALEQKLRQRRQVEADLNRQQADWEKARQKRLAEEAAAPEEPTPVPREATPVPQSQPEPEIDREEARADFADEMLAALAREADARKAVTDDEKAMAYVAQIQREIIQNWSRPPSARNGMETLLRVRLIPTGEVVDVKVEQSSGNAPFDRSAVLAVRKAERFIVPSDSRRFERDFREFTVLFRPDDLRL